MGLTSLFFHAVEVFQEIQPEAALTRVSSQI
jgi:hypothetical protein